MRQLTSTSSLASAVAFSAVTLLLTAPALRAQSEEQPAQQSQQNRDVASARPHEFFGGYGWPELPPIDRNLHLHELEKVLWASRLLLEEGAGVEELHRLHHLYAVPALLAVVLDDGGDSQLRTLVVQSLATYPSRYVGGTLVSAIPTRR